MPPPALSPRLARLREHLAARRPALDSDPALRWAAVAVILAPSPDALLLIRRAEREGDPWSGHMAFPGGRRAPGDPDLLATAIRETAEEVGVALAEDTLLGALDDVVPRTPTLPPLAIRPYAFALPNRPELTLNPEVAACRWVTVDLLLESGTYGSAHMQIRGEHRVFPAYRLGGEVVWGLTERILTPLLAVLRR